MASEQIINYKYSPEISYDPLSQIITFGNTGLFIFFDRVEDDWFMHFTPNRVQFKFAGKEKEYGLRFLLGIELLVKWFNETNFDLTNYPKPTLIYGETNENMHWFAKILFNNLNNKIYIERKVLDNNKYEAALDIELLSEHLKDMDPNSKFAKRLNEASELFKVDTNPL